MKLSRDFSLEELTATGTGLFNDPGPRESEKLLYLASYLLQPVRDAWGPLRVTSGFRSRAVNERVGGSPTSQHTRGEAADIVPVRAEIKKVYHWIVAESNLPFGQMILERKGGKEWIHGSLIRFGKSNQEALIFDNGVYRPNESI